jgi:hypothetical protein
LPEKTSCEPATVWGNNKERHGSGERSRKNLSDLMRAILNDTYAVSDVCGAEVVRRGGVPPAAV